MSLLGISMLPMQIESAGCVERVTWSADSSIHESWLLPGAALATALTQEASSELALAKRMAACKTIDLLALHTYASLSEVKVLLKGYIDAASASKTKVMLQEFGSVASTAQAKADILTQFANASLSAGLPSCTGISVHVM